MALRRVHVTIVAADKQLVLHIPIVCICSLSTQHEMRMHHIVICGLPGSTTFFSPHRRQDFQKRSY
jgi:hypothetical protein